MPNRGRGQAGRGGGRLPVGHKGERRGRGQGYASGPRRKRNRIRLRLGQSGGRGKLRRRLRIRGALPGGAQARRGASPGGRSRKNCDLPRERLLYPAPLPETRRRVARPTSPGGSPRGHEDRRGGARRRFRLRGRGDSRVRVHGGQVLLYRDEHAAASRASRHRDGGGCGSGSRAARRCFGGGALRFGGRALARTRDGVQDQRRGPPAQLLASDGAGGVLQPARWPGGTGGLSPLRRLQGRAILRFSARQARRTRRKQGFGSEARGAGFGRVRYRGSGNDAAAVLGDPGRRSLPVGWGIDHLPRRARAQERWKRASAARRSQAILGFVEGEGSSSGGFGSVPFSSIRSIHSSRTRTLRAATRGIASRTPTNPKSVPMIRSTKTMIAGCKETARLITNGWSTCDSTDCIATYTRNTQSAFMGSSTRAKRIGGITETSGPMTGMKASNPLKTPRSSAKGIPIRDQEMVKSRPIIAMYASWPNNHLWTALYISPRISRTLCRRSAGKSATKPLTNGV